MADFNACLAEVIGLSRTSCNCWDTGKPVNFDVSQSGLFISDYVPLSYTNTAKDCEKGGVWDILQTAREQAIRAFLADLPTVLNRDFKPNYTAFLGWVGSIRYSQTKVALTLGNYQAWRIKPRRINGGKIILREVSLALENILAPVSVAVDVYSNADFTTSLGTATLNFITNGFTTASFPTPVELDLSDKDANGYLAQDDDLRYYLVYQLPSGARYANNEIYANSGGCGSCGGDTLRNATNPFLTYAEIESVEAGTLGNLDANPQNSDLSARGLRLKADWGCAEMDWLCGLTYDPNALGSGESKTLAAAVANAILRKAIYFTASAILQSTNISSVTILSRESLLGKTQSSEKHYREWLIYMAQNFPQSLTDCISCKSDIMYATLKA
jgi:hypothetical protein